MERPTIFAVYPGKLSLILTLPLLATLWSWRLMAAEAAPTEQQLAEISTAIEQVQAWLEQASLQHPEQQQNLRQVELRLAVLTREAAASRAAIQQSADRLSALQAQQQELLAQKSRQTEIIEQLLRAAYMEGSQGTLKLLLNQQDPAEAARMVYYYRLLNADRMARIQQYERILTNLRVTEIDVLNTNSTLIKQSEQLDRQLQELEQEKQLQQQALAALEASIAERGAQLQNLQADREALESLLEEVRQAVEAIPPPDSRLPFAERKGKLPWPATGPLLSRFGERYGNGELQRQGLTISAAAGDPVRAVHGGRVVFANWLRGSGLLMILDHGDGYMSLYGYNQALSGELGSWVNAGAVIALAGSSGGRQQPGIYFEIRYNGRPVDPIDWLSP